MHDKLLASGNFFAKCYGGPNKVVLDIGGSLRDIFKNSDMTYITVNDKTRIRPLVDTVVDTEPDTEPVETVVDTDPVETVVETDPVENVVETEPVENVVETVDPEPVEIIVNPGNKFPFEDSSFDLIISSAFENDPCFWLTFREMTRLLKPDGFIYLMSYSNFGENNKNYYYLGQSLSYWSSYQISNEPIFPVKLIERFYVLPKYDSFVDFICVWKRVPEPQTEVSTNIKTNGPLEQRLNSNGYITFIN